MSRLILSLFMIFGISCFSVKAGAKDLILKRQLYSLEVTNAAVSPRSEGIVYFVRGIFGVFSRGLDDMGKQLRSKGVNAKVINHPAWKKAAVAILNNYKSQNSGPIILVGHSWGANAIIRIAKFLQLRNVKVQYFVTFEPNVSLPVPSNVEVGVNYYLSNSLLGQELQQEPGSKGTFENIDLISLNNIGHFNIEEQARIQAIIIKNIFRHFNKTP